MRVELRQLKQWYRTPDRLFEHKEAYARVAAVLRALGITGLDPPATRIPGQTHHGVTSRPHHPSKIDELVGEAGNVGLRLGGRWLGLARTRCRVGLW